MKADIHPVYHPVIFKDGEFEIITRSTLTSKETREIEGVSHFVIPISISSYSHPFWTGQQRFVDSAGRMERFKMKYGKNYKKEKNKEEEAEAEAEG